jgi:hypothetical protein
VRVGVVGFSDRFKGSLLPAFMNHSKELNFEMIAFLIFGNSDAKRTGISEREVGNDVKPSSTMMRCTIVNMWTL